MCEMKNKTNGEDEQLDVVDIVKLACSVDWLRGTKWASWPWENPLDVDPQVESEPWLHHVFSYLSENVGIGHREGRGRRYAGIELKSINTFTPKDDRFSSELSLVHYGNKLYAFVSGKGENAPDDQIHIWRTALQYATERLSEEHPTFSWWALVGPQTNGGQIGCLGVEFGIGPLRLREMDWACYQKESVGFSGLVKRRWLPVLVEGVCRGYSWDSASLDAHRDLRKLCSLLSLETDWFWRLCGDANIEGTRPLARPSSPMGLIEPCPWEDEKELRSRKVNIDIDRMVGAWERVNSDTRVQTAIDAFYEGMSLKDSHPSFALVAFASAIESMGRLLFEEEIPQRCEACGKNKVNPSRQLFRKAIELVERPDRAKRMTERIYGWRSGTAHSGHTFGFEDTFGRRSYTCWNLEERPEDDFFVRGVYSGQQAARSLLLKLFSGELPNTPAPVA